MQLKKVFRLSVLTLIKGIISVYNKQHFKPHKGKGELCCNACVYVVQPTVDSVRPPTDTVRPRSVWYWYWCSRSSCVMWGKACDAAVQFREFPVSLRSMWEKNTKRSEINMCEAFGLGLLFNNCKQWKKPMYFPETSMQKSPSQI